eukprot:2429518-Amphidinium_carterae.2
MGFFIVAAHVSTQKCCNEHVQDGPSLAILEFMAGFSWEAAVSSVLHSSQSSEVVKYDDP